MNNNGIFETMANTDAIYVDVNNRMMVLLRMVRIAMRANEPKKVLEAIEHEILKAMNEYIGKVDDENLQIEMVEGMLPLNYDLSEYGVDDGRGEQDFIEECAAIIVAELVKEKEKECVDNE